MFQLSYWHLNRTREREREREYHVCVFKCKKNKEVHDRGVGGEGNEKKGTIIKRYHESIKKFQLIKGLYFTNFINSML